MDEPCFEFSKIPQKLLTSLEESYQEIKKKIIEDLKEELLNEYEIDIRDSGRKQI